jgi:hypothetical protein
VAVSASAFCMLLYTRLNRRDKEHTVAGKWNEEAKNAEEHVVVTFRASPVSPVDIKKRG